VNAQTTSSEVACEGLLADGNPVYEDNSVVILPSAREKFADMFTAIAQAKRYVHVEYFNLRNDSIGWVMLHLLERKAEEGIEVRVLIDAFGYRNDKNTLTEAMCESVRSHGVKIAIFDPMKFPYINHALHRDHRKIVVVDGQMVYTGGINVADYYLKGKPKIGEWRDMHMRMEGPVVDGYEQIFSALWEKTTGEHLDSVTYVQKQPLTDFSGLKLDTTPTAGEKKIVVVNREPHELSKQMRKAYITAVDAAKEEIRIVNPYMMNVRSVRKAMYRALKRGVRFRIMVSATCDNPLVPNLVAIEMKKMMKRGAEVYYYSGGFHHSKIMMIDKTFCTVGTANLDARSLSYDYEVNSFIFDPYTTAELNQIFDTDLSNCEILTPLNFKKRFSLGQRVVGRVFSGLKGIL